jgi:dipeptidyl aminopeptidase/acylaminoacyl peptidase
VAFSPDGAELAVEQAATDSIADARLRVVDLATGVERDLATDGVLAGPAAWSPDGRLIATTTLESSGAPVGVPDPGLPTGLSFVDPSGRGSDVPSALELPLAGPGRVLGWTDAGEVVTLLDVEGYDPCCGPEAHTLSRVPIDGASPTPLTRIGNLQGYGVGRFQMASSLAEDLAVVDPDDVDRGPWPWLWRVGLASVVGLAAWLAARLVAYVLRRRRS